MRLTVKTSDGLKLKPGQGERIVFDDDIPGLGLRIREGGSRTWIYQYRIGKKQRRMVLGTASSAQLNLADMRKTAAKLQGRVALGQDPAMDKEAAKREVENTFVGFANQFLEARKPSWRLGTYKEARRHLLYHAQALHSFPIAAVSQFNIAKLLDDIVEQSGGVTANRVRVSLATLFAWIMKRGIRLPDGNVAANTDKPVEEKSRDRVLSDAELKAIWASCGDDDYGAIIKLLMLTGCRANEIGSLRRDEVHDEQIILPAGRTKNGRAHIVPLSNVARGILAARHGAHDFVFGRTGTGFGGWSKAKAALSRRASMKDWNVHDIRRTVATRMAELGVQPHIIEAVLNHVSGHKGGVAGIYNRATYDKEKREALNLWAEHVTAIVEGRKAVVVPMKRA